MMNVISRSGSEERSATYADLETVPPHLVAEIIDGDLVTRPRPTPRHTFATNALIYAITGPFQKGINEPGAWIFADEPELHLKDHVVVPDLAGWCRERLPAPPSTAHFEVAPDWICEVLSASTEGRDRTSKRRIYAEAGVGHLWLVDPRFQLLEAFALSEQGWLLNGGWRSDDEVRAPPFDAASFCLADLWPRDQPLGFNENPQHLFAGDR